ncbi:MAG: BlaI/MecI/CopY family transcriptional regulator [Phycisphaerae bacterium]|nr:BlaI/MecI/CopY family transcriptional regulator [Phycisphaerae bacterium]
MPGKTPKSAVPEESRGARPPRAELEVLSCLWQRGKATVRELREAMAEYRPMAHGSVVNLLKRLEAKGLVRHEKGPVGKAFVYLPTRRPEPTRRRLVSDMLQRIFGGNGVAMISTFLDAKSMTARELDQMEELIRQKRSKKTSET